MKPKSANINGILINYYDSGASGLPVVFLHGNSLSALTFKKQFESESLSKYRLIAFDFPGHGLSGKSANPSADYSPAGLINLFIGFLKELSIENCVICGHSLGGHIAIEALPELNNVTGILVWGTPPLGSPPAVDKAFHPFPAIMLAYKGELTRDESEQLAIGFTAGETADTEIVEMILNTDTMFRPAIGAALMAGGLKDEVKIVSELKLPLAVLQGEKEKLINPDYFKSVTIPTLWRNNVHIIAGSGHSLQMETPEKFNALLSEYLRGFGN